MSKNQDSAEKIEFKRALIEALKTRRSYVANNAAVYRANKMVTDKDREEVYGELTKDFSQGEIEYYSTDVLHDLWVKHVYQL